MFFRYFFVRHFRFRFRYSRGFVRLFQFRCCFVFLVGWSRLVPPACHSHTESVPSNHLTPPTSLAMLPRALAPYTGQAAQSSTRPHIDRVNCPGAPNNLTSLSTPTWHLGRAHRPASGSARRLWGLVANLFSTRQLSTTSTLGVVYSSGP